ncbi:SDR family NAD(P)-dependent oxidoreductase [Microbispora triticiradicis]|uniref:SDR family NAD(P)-dependent oxidoreductase n=1 Tax=Microbispora triticiradicis TaxID=2200763 RepID=A0ABX9LV71_9ACTN|nr:SDR family NAD(P)-dependent oxidoreductase [Microbispora triticiradicis]RGA06854.1 SDR family NAD(P)-dependent oxidoreductase [Microbispora triticiradicis]GLW23424.1 retinol dehydrogenase [Microbispora amethystogenes]
MTRTAVVTGGSRGIGQAVAARLAEEGYRVVIVARDPVRGEAARAALPGDAVLVVADLGETASVREAAGALLDACPRLDVLVHNAGVWPARREITADGVERAFAVNHFAPFLLNHLLEERLRESGTRVVQVSAGLYVKGRAEPGRTATGLDFHPIRTYADTKLCNLMMVPLFARRWQDAGVTIDAVHPGVIRTDLGARGGPLGLVLKAVKRTWDTPEAGARPVVRLALDASGGTGRYFEIDEETPLAPVARDAALAEALWSEAAALTGTA